TATQQTAASWLVSCLACGRLPIPSALTYVPGQTVSNLVVAKVGNGGRVSLRNASGSVHLIVEILGWYSDGTGAQPAGGLYGPIEIGSASCRDSGSGAPVAPTGAGGS